MFANDLTEALSVHFEGIAFSAARSAFGQGGPVSRIELRHRIVEDAQIDLLVLGEPQYHAPRDVAGDTERTVLQCVMSFSGASRLLMCRSRSMQSERQVCGNIENDAIILSLSALKSQFQLARIVLASDVELVIRYVHAQTDELAAYEKNIKKSAMRYIADSWNYHNLARSRYALEASLDKVHLDQMDAIFGT